MFWEYGITVSAIDQLLEKEPVAILEEILSEPDVIQELKTNNEKLVTYLTEPSTLAKIFDMVIMENNDLVARNSKEILVCGAQAIDNVIFDDRNNILKLYGVFTNKYEQNTDQNTEPNTENDNNKDSVETGPSLAVLRRIVTIFEHLAQYRAHELLECLDEDNEECSIFKDLFGLLRYQPVAELIVKLVTARNDEECRVKSFARIFLEGNHSDQLVEAVIDADTEIAKGALYVVSELFRWVRCELSNGDTDIFEFEIVNSLQKDEIVTKLFKHIVDNKEKNDYKLENKWPAVSMLCLIFNLQRTGDINGDEFICPSYIPIISMNLSKKKFSTIIEYIEPLFIILKNSKSSSTQKMGKFRIMLLELLVSLTLYNYEDLSIEISRLEIPSYLLNLFDEFPENNISHNLIELCITSILMGYRWKTYNGAHLYIDNNLILSLFKTEFFIRKLIKLSHSKKNYIGHIRQIQRTFRLALSESYHKTILCEILDGFSDELKNILMEADDILVKIDQIEAIDSRFLKVMTDDFDAASFNQEQPTTVTIEKSIDFFKSEKSALFPEDIAENFENQMFLDIDTSGVDDKFDEMKIPKIELDVNQDFLDATISKVKDITEYQIKIDDLSNNNNSNNKNLNHSSSIEMNIKIIPDNPENNPNIDKIKDSGTNLDTLNTITTDRCATSSPLIGEFQKLSFDENTFDDDSNSNND